MGKGPGIFTPHPKNGTPQSLSWIGHLGCNQVGCGARLPLSAWTLFPSHGSVNLEILSHLCRDRCLGGLPLPDVKVLQEDFHEALPQH